MKIYPIYFTCAGHIPLLRMSLITLWAADRARELIPEIHLCFSNLSPPEEYEIERMKAELPAPITWSVRNHAGWGGFETIRTELKTFSDMGRKHHPDDWIMQIDSDVLFAPKVLSLLDDVRDCDFIGQIFSYKQAILAQGGCYFVRCGFARLFEAWAQTMNRDGVRTLADRLGQPECPEDAYISWVVSELLGDMRLRNFYGLHVFHFSGPDKSQMGDKFLELRNADRFEARLTEVPGLE